MQAIQIATPGDFEKEIEKLMALSFDPFIAAMESVF